MHSSVALQGQFMWSMASMSSFFKVWTSWRKPLSKPVSLSDGIVNGQMVSHFLRSQHSIVANSLTWWFQSLEKAQTSLYVWIHNIIWIYIILIHVMWIHALGIHIYHMISYIWIRFKQIPIFSDWHELLIKRTLLSFFENLFM